MIRSFFGIAKHPFGCEDIALLPQQQDVFETLRVHCQQGGLCLLMGEPGTGKSVIKQALTEHDPRRLIVPTVARTLHSYFNTLRILCQAFHIDFDGGDFRCEKRLIEEASRLNQQGKMLAPIIDDAHLMELPCLRKLRLLFEDFPKNHNLILLAQPTLMSMLSLSINEDIRSRVTYSVILKPMNPDQTRDFILDQLDRCGLGHNAFSEQALNLIVRSAEGRLRRARNLSVASLLEAVRDQTRTVDIKQVNRVLIQPHWRHEQDIPQPSNA